MIQPWREVPDSIHVCGRKFAWPKWDRVAAHNAVVSAEEQVARAVNFAPTKRIAIQAGGNCGVWPWLLSRSFKWVYSFEPSLENFHYLAENCKDRGNVFPIFGALSDNPGSCGVKLHKKGNCGDFRTITAHKGLIPRYALDDFCLGEVGLIYLDVQGDEYQALLGALSSIEDDHPAIVFEWAPEKCPHRGDTLGLMAKLGYREVDQNKLDRYWTWGDA